MAVLNTPRLGLPYPDGTDLLRDGDNRIHDLAAALDDVDVVLTRPGGGRVRCPRPRPRRRLRPDRPRA